MVKRLAVIWSNLFSVAWQLLFFYRIIRFLRQRRGFNFLIIPLAYLQQLISGCHIHYTANIGKDIRLPHPTGIVIGHDVEIGNRVTIFQHVTLGSHGRRGEEAGYPVIEDDVILWANVLVNKDLVIGKGAVLLADSGTERSLEGGKTYWGTPAIEARKKWKEIAVLKQLVENYSRKQS